MARVLDINDIERISLAELINGQPKAVIMNTGLSEELKKELSADITNDFFIILLRLNVGGEWRNYSNDKTEVAGVNQNGEPIYKTTWNGEDWQYLPFEVTFNSLKSSGELVGTSIQMGNFDPALVTAFDEYQNAMAVKLYAISKNTQECIVKDEFKYITSYVNTGIVLQGEIMPADVLNEQLPCSSFDGLTFRR